MEISKQSIGSYHSFNKTSWQKRLDTFMFVWFMGVMVFMFAGAFVSIGAAFAIDAELAAQFITAE